MRWTCSGLALAVLAACGGGGGNDPVSPNPPPPPPPSNPGAPASLAVQAGDGQSAEPGAKVTARPAVIVRDASGRVVPNTAVTFTVDSGGGSLTATAATTGADGIATAGDWTLGPAEGRNVVTARAATLSAKVVATSRYQTAEVSNQVLPSGGGTLAVNGTSPLAGLRIEAPAGAFPGGASVQVSIGSSLGIALPAGARIASPLVTIATDATGLAGEVLTLRIPARIAPGEFPVIVFVDPVKGYLELLATAEFDSTGVTAESMALVPAPALPTAALSALRGTGRLPAAVNQPTKKADLLVVAYQPQFLDVDRNTSFVPGVDDWEFERQQTPLGTTLIGQVFTALYFFQHRKGTSGDLFDNYPEAFNVPTSNSSGIYWSAGLSKDLEPYVTKLLMAAEQRYAKNPQKYDEYSIKTTVAAMNLSGGGPQAVTYLSLPQRSVRAGVAYRWSAGARRLQHANPQFPGDQDRFSEWPGNRLSGCTPAPCIMVAGLNYLGGALDTQWGSFRAGTMYKDRFPAAFIQRLTPALGGPGSNDDASPDTLFLVRDTASIWASVPSWPLQLASGVPGVTNVQGSKLYLERSEAQWTESTQGTFQPFKRLDAAFLQTSSNDPGVNLRIGIEVRGVVANAQESTDHPWMGFKIYRVIKFLPRLEAVYAAPGTPTRFTLTTEGGPPLPANYRYRIDWNDNSQSEWTSKPSEILHIYDSKEPREVKLEIVHPGSGQVVAKTSFLLGGLAVSPKPFEGEFDTKYTLTANYGGPLPPNPVYEWDLGDGRKVEGPSKTIEVAYPATLAGEEVIYPIKVVLRSGSDIEATGSTSATMLDRIVAWKLTAISLTYSFVNTQVHSDGRWVIDSTRFARINAGQSEAAIAVKERRYLSTCNEACALHEVPVGLYLWEGPVVNYATMWNPVNRNATAKETFAGAPMALPAAPLVYSWWMVRQLQTSPPPFCSNPNETFTLTGNANQGRVAGWVVHNCWGLEGGLLAGFPKITMDADVTFSGATASGYIELTYWFYPNGGNANAIQRKIARLQFSAARIQ